MSFNLGAGTYGKVTTPDKDGSTEAIKETSVFHYLGNARHMLFQGNLTEATVAAQLRLRPIKGLISIHRVRFVTSLQSHVQDSYEITMERAPKGDLRHLLHRVDSMKFLRNAGEGIMDKLLEIVYQMHEYGLVHQDLKPENIVLMRQDDREFELKIIDFGACSFVDMSQLVKGSNSTIKGTYAYNPPEVFLGKVHLNPFKLDAFAVGCVVFEVLFGSLEHPYVPHVDTCRSFDEYARIDFEATLREAHRKLDSFAATRGAGASAWIADLKSLLELDPDQRATVKSVYLKRSKLIEVVDPKSFIKDPSEGFMISIQDQRQKYIDFIFDRVREKNSGAAVAALAVSILDRYAERVGSKNFLENDMMLPFVMADAIINSNLYVLTTDSEIKTFEAIMTALECDLLAETAEVALRIREGYAAMDIKAAELKQAIVNGRGSTLATVAAYKTLVRPSPPVIDLTR
jgi:serine/threonine protein kinase